MTKTLWEQALVLECSQELHTEQEGIGISLLWGVEVGIQIKLMKAKANLIR